MLLSTMVAIRPSGLFSVFRPRQSSDAKSPEHMRRSSIFFGILVHIDDIKRNLGPKWPAFAEELRIRLEPITLTPSGEISSLMLYNATDEVIDQCKSWPEAAEVTLCVFKKTDILLPTIGLPTDWKVKQDLMTTFYRLYDKLQREGVGELESPRGETSPQGFMEVPVWFGTCRQPSAGSSSYFGTERADSLSLGVVRVSIPDADLVAQTHSSLPYMWYHDKFRPATSKRSVVISKCIGMTEGILRHHMSRYKLHVQLEKGGWARETCIYVHGFNNRFVNAAKKMALCGYKMQVDVPLFMFSWPSYQVGFVGSICHSGLRF